MTLSPELTARAHQLALESRRAQGLPDFIEDEGTIERICRLIEVTTRTSSETRKATKAA